LAPIGDHERDRSPDDPDSTTNGQRLRTVLSKLEIDLRAGVAQQLADAEILKANY
jgi:hypothetical protein